MHKIKINLPVWILAFGLILGSYQNHIALFEHGNEKPIKVFPYSLSVFPAEDQQRLQQGIEIADNTHLERLLQDYLS